MTDTNTKQRHYKNTKDKTNSSTTTSHSCRTLVDSFFLETLSTCCWVSFDHKHVSIYVNFTSKWCRIIICIVYVQNQLCVSKWPRLEHINVLNNTCYEIYMHFHTWPKYANECRTGARKITTVHVKAHD